MRLYLCLQGFQLCFFLYMLAFAYIFYQAVYVAYHIIKIIGEVSYFVGIIGMYAYIQIACFNAVYFVIQKGYPFCKRVGKRQCQQC